MPCGKRRGKMCSVKLHTGGERLGDQLMPVGGRGLTLQAEKGIFGQGAESLSHGQNKYETPQGKKSLKRWGARGGD